MADYRYVRKHVSGDRTYGFDFGPRLLSGTETLTGTPTVSISPSGELAAASPQVNAAIFYDVDNSTTIAADEGVLAQLSGGTAGTDYEVTVSCEVAPDGETEAETFIVAVYDD